MELEFSGRLPTPWLAPCVPGDLGEPIPPPSTAAWPGGAGWPPLPPDPHPRLLRVGAATGRPGRRRYGLGINSGGMVERDGLKPSSSNTTV